MAGITFCSDVDVGLVVSVDAEHLVLMGNMRILPLCHSLSPSLSLCVWVFFGSNPHPIAREREEREELETEKERFTNNTSCFDISRHTHTHTHIGSVPPLSLASRPSMLVVQRLLLLWTMPWATHAFVHLPSRRSLLYSTGTNTSPLSMVSIPDGQSQSPQQDNDNDWRSFKARLVQQEQQQQQQQDHHHYDSNKKKQQHGHKSTAWLYEQTVLEKGCVLIHCPDPSDPTQVLDHHALHQAVVLVTKHTPQYTEGILLNRPTTLDHYPEEFDDVIFSSIRYGGDIGFLQSQHSSLCCLHTLSSLKDMSTAVLLKEGLYGMPVSNAVQCIRAGDATIQDFVIVSGKVRWTTVDLLTEQLQQEWRIVSVDAKSLFRWCQQEDNNRSDGPSFPPKRPFATIVPSLSVLWNRLQQITSYEPDYGTSDWIQQATRVQQEWMRICVNQHYKQQRQRQHKATTPTSPSLRPGQVLRSVPTPDFVFGGQQDLYQSLMLILQDDDDFTVSVLLHHPTTEIEMGVLSLKPGNTYPDYWSLPVRHGGWYNQQDVDVPMPPFAIHRYHPNLVNQQDDSTAGATTDDDKGGTDKNMLLSEPIGTDDHPLFYKTSLHHVDLALAKGLADPSDFLLIKGMCVWEKTNKTNNPTHLPNDPQNSSPTALHQYVADGKLEQVPPEQMTKVVWELLGRQRALMDMDPTSLDWNMRFATRAWAAAAPRNSHGQQQEQQPRTSWFSRNTARKDDKALRKLGKEMLKTLMMIHLVVEENDDDEDDDCSTE